jgi:hypothetical protein
MTAETRTYAPPGDRVRLTSDEPLVFELAEKLWAPAPPNTERPGLDIEIQIESESEQESEKERERDSEREKERPEDFLEGASGGGPQAGGALRGAADLAFAFEEAQRWTHEASQFRCEVPGTLSVTIDFVTARVAARLAPSLFTSLALFSSFSRSSPLPLLPSKKSSSSSLPLSLPPPLLSFLARTLLEAPAAVLLGRRGWQVLHAGAVVGPRGAAVLRGPSGAGKSTLVAAAHRSGLGVLGDESLFVSRRDPDALSASVRDLALREDSARLLGIFETTEPAFTGRELKRRVDLFNGGAPRDRSARRAATVLLGAREPRPARLEPLRGEAFRRAFAEGGIPQELPGDPGEIARAWSSDGFLLAGAADLDGAVRLLRDLVT